VHVVKGSDTVYSIAKQYNTTIERILELNGMTKDDKLTTDQRIYVQ
ncbi:MAG: LysM peptidoglycan-binding domain-containing protein, partial [Saprospiraceae bacterium]|nr:LysM peptidoglycan-binding domain-containing protein [Saprospiraceae bacterium]